MKGRQGASGWLFRVKSRFYYWMLSSPAHRGLSLLLLQAEHLDGGFPKASLQPGVGGQR